MPDPALLASTDADVTVTEDLDSVVGVDVLYTDVWISMGQESERTERLRSFPPYQLNGDLVALTRNPEVKLMHCLPAHRGEEITGDVIDGPQSIVFDEAENRLHVQKGILVWLNEVAV